MATKIPGKLRLELEKAARQAAANGIAKFKEERPEAAGLSVKLEAFAFKRRPRELDNAAARAVTWFLYDKKTVHLTNKDLAKRFEADVFHYQVPPSLLTTPFTSADRRKVAEALAAKDIKLDLTKHNSASKVKSALKAIYAGADAERTATVTVTFSADFVIVGTRRFPINQNGSHRRIQVDGGKLNVAALQALLCT